MKKEINSLKRQIKFYKEKLKLDLINSNKKLESHNFTNKKVFSNITNKSKNNVDNLILELKCKSDIINDNFTTNSKSAELNNDQNKATITYNLTVNDKLQLNTEENFKEKFNKICEKSPTIYYNESESKHNGNIKSQPKNYTTRDNLQLDISKPYLIKSLSKSPKKELLEKIKTNKKNFHLNNSHNDKNKVNSYKKQINLNKYINDVKNSKENQIKINQKPDFLQSFKNKILKKTMIRDLLNKMNHTDILSPRKRNKEDLNKEVLGFIDDLGSKLDEEMLNLTDLENVLIRAKLDLKSEDKDNKIADREVLNSFQLENKKIFNSQEGYIQFINLPNKRTIINKTNNE